MPLGPIFEVELVQASRTGRTYALRLAYGLTLLGLAASRCRGGQAGGWGSLLDLSRCARGAFEALVLAQGAAVVFLTPALVAGAIAGEVQRKTLHDLLTSDLNGREIVLGKLGARTLLVLMLVAAGFPILLLTGLLGGHEVATVVAAEGVTCATVVFLAALAILASTQTRSVRGALNFTMTLALTWLILPGAVEVLLPRKVSFGFELYQWLAPVNAWIAASSPFAVWVETLRGTTRAPGALATRLAWMAALQLAYGALLAATAVAVLRPSYRGREGQVRRRPAATSPAAPRRRRITSGRRPCGDDAMIWKELFATSPPPFYRSLGFLIGGALGGLLIWTTLGFAVPAFGELVARGYGPAAGGSARGVFHFYLRIVGTGIFLVYVLGVASDAAAGFAGEREEDTWVSLIATPLTGREIVRAKILGAIWGIRHSAIVLLGLVLLGIAAGSLHPISLISMLMVGGAATWFASALGAWFSLRSERTMPAAARTLGVLLALNVGVALILSPWMSGRPGALVACLPFHFAATMVSHGDLRGHFATSAMGLMTDATLSRYWARSGLETALTCLVGVSLYALGAQALTRSAGVGFDAMLDRPEVTAGGLDAAAAPRPPALAGAPHDPARRGQRPSRTRGVRRDPVSDPAQ